MRNCQLMILRFHVYFIKNKTFVVHLSNHFVLSSIDTPDNKKRKRYLNHFVL